MSEPLGTITVAAAQLEFDSAGGTTFPLVEVEDIVGGLHQGRFVGRRTGTAGLRLKLMSPNGDTQWVECVPTREVTIFVGR